MDQTEAVFGDVQIVGCRHRLALF